MRGFLVSSEGVIDEAVVDAVIREAVLSGVTGAEIIEGYRRTPLPLYDGDFGLCLGELTPFCARGVLFTGLRERGVVLVLADEMMELNLRRTRFSGNHDVLEPLTTATLRVVALLFTLALGLKANDDSMFEFVVARGLVGDAGLDGMFSAIFRGVGRGEGEFRTFEELYGVTTCTWIWSIILSRSIALMLLTLAFRVGPSIDGERKGCGDGCLQCRQLTAGSIRSNPLRSEIPHTIHVYKFLRSHPIRLFLRRRRFVECVIDHLFDHTLDTFIARTAKSSNNTLPDIFPNHIHLNVHL